MVKREVRQKGEDGMRPASFWVLGRTDAWTRLEQDKKVEGKG